VSNSPTHLPLLHWVETTTYPVHGVGYVSIEEALKARLVCMSLAPDRSLFTRNMNPVSFFYNSVFSKSISNGKVDLRPQIATTFITTFCLRKSLHIESPPKHSFINTEPYLCYVSAVGLWSCSCKNYTSPLMTCVKFRLIYGNSKNPKGVMMAVFEMSSG
jgi:hypothetical protein